MAEDDSARLATSIPHAMNIAVMPFEECRPLLFVPARIDPVLTIFLIRSGVRSCIMTRCSIEGDACPAR